MTAYGANRITPGIEDALRRSAAMEPQHPCLPRARLWLDRSRICLDGHSPAESGGSTLSSLVTPRRPENCVRFSPLAPVACVLTACVPVKNFVDESCVSGPPPAERTLDAECESRLQAAFAASTFDSVVLMDRETVIFRGGDSLAASNIASVRKSVVSVLRPTSDARGMTATSHRSRSHPTAIYR
jgi:hypothetical protein